MGRRIDNFRKKVLANVVHATHMRYLQTAEPVWLDRAIQLQTGLLMRLALDDPKRVDALADLGDLHGMRFDARENPTDTEMALRYYETALQSLSPGHPQAARVQLGMPGALANRFKVDRDAAKLDQAIGLLEQVIAEAAPEDHDSLTLASVNLGLSLLERFEMTQNLSDVERAVDSYSRAVDLTSPENPMYALRVVRMENAKVLLALLGDGPVQPPSEHLEEARRRMSSSLAVDQTQVMALMAPLLAFPPQEVVSLLREGPAREILRQALMESLTGARPQTKAEGLALIGSFTLMIATESGKPELLGEAVSVLRQAVTEAPEGDPGRGRTLSYLASGLGTMMQFTGDTTMLPELIRVARAAVEAAPADEPEYGGLLANLGNALVKSYELNQNAASLEEAIAVLGQAVDALPDSNLQRPNAYTNLGAALFRLFELRQDPDILEESLTAHREAARLAGANYYNRALISFNLSNALLARFMNVGDQRDLHEAIALGREELSSVGPQSMLWSSYVTSLAQALERRAHHSDQRAAIAEVLDLLREAARATPEGSLDRPRILAALGRALISAYEMVPETIGTEALDEAVELFREAWTTSPRGSQDALVFEGQLGQALQVRAFADIPGFSAGSLATTIMSSHFDVSGLLRGLPGAAESPQLKEGVRRLEHALASRVVDQGGAPRFVTSLAMALHRLRLLTRGDDVSRSALQTLRRACADLPERNPARAYTHFWLAQILTKEWSENRDPASVDAVVNAYREAVEVVTVPTTFRAVIAEAWGRFVAESIAPAAAVDPFAIAIDLLEAAAWHGLGRDEQERVLGRFDRLSVDAAACAIAADQPGRALELLERGRGILLTQAIEGRGILEAARDAAPEQVERLARIQARLADLDVSGDIAGPGLDERHRLHFERTALIEEIRSTPELSEILRRPVLADLLREAERGWIVVVNVSGYRCDALLVRTDRVESVPLEITASAVTDRMSRLLAPYEDHAYPVDGDTALHALRDREADLTASLGWLWDQVAEPVLDALFPAAGTPERGRPRLWWCLTGQLALAPIHAAGHDFSGSATGRCVADRVVSSYTPTIRTLSFSRQSRARSTSDAARRPLLVSVPGSPGRPPLAGAEAEIESLVERFPEALVLRDGDATPERVLAELEETTWVHFACHATHVPALPSTSHLSLSEGPLSVHDLHRLTAQPARLAVLSACETSHVGETLPDESISLAAAMQVAGFSEVVSTMWPVSDKTAQTFSDIFHSRLADASEAASDDTVALAVDEATRFLMRRRPSTPHLWAGFVHLGG